MFYFSATFEELKLKLQEAEEKLKRQQEIINQFQVFSLRLRHLRPRRLV